jgi:nitrate/nitrite transporter NarK
VSLCFAILAFWHTAFPAITSGLSLIAAAYLEDPVLIAIAFIVCTMGNSAAITTFWTLPTGFLTGLAAAGGIAVTNSIGALGGFVGPYVIGWIKDSTGEITLGLVVLGIGPIMSGIFTLLMGHDSKMEMAGSHIMKQGGASVTGASRSA